MIYWKIYAKLKFDNLKKEWDYMDNQKIETALVFSCKKYYHFLEEMQKSFPTKYGQSVIAVLNINGGSVPNVFELTVAQKIVNPDMCYIYVDHQKCDHIFIKQCNFRSGNRSVLIEVNEPFLEEFKSITPERLKIVSDMKFLIENLSDFYQTHKIQLMPPAPCTLTDIPQDLIGPMSNEQRDAYYGVFANPVSYVWGAPGTGKTNMVLSRCILRYVMNSKRIILLAPTNNAIEQVLRGILPAMKKSGISLDTVYRLGTSTEEFAKQYPEVVGNRDLERAIAELCSDINAINQKITRHSELKTSYTKNKEYNAFLHSIRDAIIPLTSDISMLSNKISQTQAELAKKDATYKEIEQRKRSLEDTHAQQSLRISNCQRLIDKNISTLNRWRHFFWKKRNCEQLDAENAQLYLVLFSLKEELSKTEKELSAVRYSHATALVELKAVESDHTSLSKESADLEQQLSEMFSSNLCIKPLAPTHPFTCEKMDNCVESVNKLVAASDRQLANAYNPDAEEDILSLQLRLSQMEKELKTLHQNKKMEQKRRAWVLAGTIESALNNLCVPDDEPPVSHVFIDEAGYTSLARGLSAFVCNCPVSFFGDHLQLPPICEMEKIQPDSMEVSLFSLSVAHYPAVLSDSMHDIYTNFYKLEKPPFEADTMPILPLTYTYRFSDTLAQLLSMYFYPLDFHGDSNAPFEVVILDAPHRSGENKRTNPSELLAIKEYLTISQENDYAILTPYRNQQALLRNAGFDKEKVLTVHRSQGREWNTVIFSVVDSYDKFYVDSNHPKGKQVLNTAISRARQRLVIACDTSYWSKQHGQFIQSLLKLTNTDV